MKALAVFIIFGGLALAQASGPLTDQRIMQLAQSGVRPDELIRLVQTAPTISFDLTPAATDQMLQAGVSEDVIKAMAAREAGPQATVSPGAPPLLPGQLRPVSRSDNSEGFIHRGMDEVTVTGALFVPHSGPSDVIAGGITRFGVFASRSVEMGAEFGVASANGVQVYTAGPFARYMVHAGSGARVFPFFGGQAGDALLHADGASANAFTARGEVGIKAFVSPRVSVEAAYNLLYLYVFGFGFGFK